MKPKPSPLSIVRATGEHIPQLEEMCRAGGLNKPAGYFARCLAEQREIVMAARGGEAVGYGLLNWRPQYALYRKLQIPEIQDLNVIPAARRHGIATVLMSCFEEMARAAKCAHIGISVGLYADYGPAQRLYVKLGYMPDGYGVTYDRMAVAGGEIRPVDDNLCLMMVKELKNRP
jgi:GNAT superfamily N-acetyltransferase